MTTSVQQPLQHAPWWVTLSSTAIRSVPFGRYSLANTLARFADRPFLARLAPELGGAAFVCDLTDSIAREVCFTGRYEPQETQIAQRLLRPGMSVVDVGANWGYFSLACAHLVGSNGRVIALEPHPALAQALRSNVGANGLTQVEVVALAAAAHRETRGFVGFAAAGGNTGLTRAASASDRADFTCETVALDRLLDERACGRVDLVKIDIEGGEADATDGMAEGLARRRYRYVLLECHPALLERAGSSIDRCLEPFHRSRYRGWQIDHSAAMHRRAATGAVPLAELLLPIDSAALGSDIWPHLLWAAPDEALPA